MSLIGENLRWMLVHTTSALPYVLVMLYLVWVHMRAIGKAGDGARAATLTALACTMVTAGAFTFNQPPFRFMVSIEANALVKDIALVVQALLLTIFTDQVRGRQRRLAWTLRSLGGLVPVIHAYLFFATGRTLVGDVIHVAWTVTAYGVGCYLYAAIAFALEYRRSTAFHVRWRVGTMVVGLLTGILYLLGRGIMGMVPPALLRGEVVLWGVVVGGTLVWVNRLMLTLTTVLLTLGLALPDWYRKLGAWLHVLRRAGDHLDHLIALLGRITDQELKLKDEPRLRLRAVAAWLARELGFAPESRKVIEHLAMMTPVRALAADRPVPPERLEEEQRLDLVTSVGLFSAVYLGLKAVEEGDALRHPEAQVVQAARLYVEGSSLEQIERVCPGRAAEALGGLLALAAGHDRRRLHV